MKTFFVLSGLFALPLFAFAHSGGPAGHHTTGGLVGVIGTLSQIVNAAIPLIIALAVLYFFWGLAQYILSQGNEEKKGAGRDIMIWGIIALFVMVTVFGLIELLQTTFNVDNVTPDLPTLF